MSWAAILIASLLGSLHCVGMCGGFVALVAGAGEGPRRLAPLLTYQATRGATYVLLGALAGLLGAGLERGGALLGLQKLAGPAMGVALIVLAITSLWPRRPNPANPERLVGLARGSRPRIGILQRARLTLTRSLRERGARAAAAAGLLTALLPCGWLWAYVLFAAGTGTPLAGALAMFVFWLGTIPALLGVGLVAGELGRRLGRHAPRITAIAMLVLGLLSLAGKFGPPPPPASDASVTSTTTTTTVTTPPSDAPCH